MLAVFLGPESVQTVAEYNSLPPSSRSWQTPDLCSYWRKGREGGGESERGGGGGRGERKRGGGIGEERVRGGGRGERAREERRKKRREEGV